MQQVFILQRFIRENFTFRQTISVRAIAVLKSASDMKIFIPTSTNKQFLEDWDSTLVEIDSKRIQDLENKRQHELAKTQRKEKKNQSMEEKTNKNKAAVAKKR